MIRKQFIRNFLLNVLCAAALFAADGPSLLSQVEKPTPDPAKSGTVKQLVFTHDRIRITLEEGTLQYSTPVEGVVIAAAFRGKGTLEVIPPNTLESQQLSIFTGEEKLSESFTEAAFLTTDKTFELLAPKIEFGAAVDAHLAELMAARVKENEEWGAEVLPRMVKGLLSGNRPRTALFIADVKTDKHGWLQARYDNLKIEEIRIGRLVQMEVGRHFDTWMQFAAAGRDPFTAFQNPLERADYEVANYVIDASVNDNAELHATAHVELKYRAEQERVILFDLDSNMRVESVTDSKGEKLGFLQPRENKDRVSSYGDYVAVILPKPSHTGDTEKLEFTYGGKRVIRKVGAGNFFCESSGWYPEMRDSFASRATFELHFKSPKKYSLVATGSKTDETTDGNLLLTTWKSDIPQAVAGFAYGDYKVVTEKAGDVEVQIYANRQGDENLEAIQHIADGAMVGSGESGLALGTLTPASMAKGMATEVANNVRVFEQYYGPLPFKHLAVTNIPYSYGQGWPGLLYLSVLSFLDSTQRHQLLRNNNDIRLTDFFRAHETSHQWWGHRVGWKSYHDQWLSEGFAQFSGNLYVQYRQNFQEYLKRLRADKFELATRDRKNRTYESIGPIWMGTRISNSDAPRAYQPVIYNKGGYVLHMLRMMLWDSRSQVPDHRFIEMMKDFTSTYDNKAASTEDFRAIAEKHMTKEMELEPGKGLIWFFREYVYNVGIPHYEFSYKIEPAEAGKYHITGSLVRTGVPAGWMDAMPLYADFGGGKIAKIGAIPAIRPNTPIEATLALPQRPEKLILNAHEDVLAEVKQ